MGPLGGADLRFRSPQPDTGLHCETTDTGLMHCVVSVYFPAEAGTHSPTPEGWKTESKIQIKSVNMTQIFWQWGRHILSKWLTAWKSRKNDSENVVERNLHFEEAMDLMHISCTRLLKVHQFLFVFMCVSLWTFWTPLIFSCLAEDL